ncbi:MAG: DUF3530 family protein [Gammaproteobacteria bacterium]|nr:DUF3530 family protein [Gammaproteobacteria bacterium]
MAIALMLTIMASVTHATESDVGKEQRWAEQVIDGLLDGDEAWLNDGKGHEFLGILTEGDSESGRAVILMHGIGVHPNWPDVIYPLREALLEAEVTSLSIQMPILANEAEAIEYAPLFEEVPDRVEAAIGYLSAAGYRDIALVAHSMGASMLSFYLSRTPDSRAGSAVLIGMGQGQAFKDNIKVMETFGLPLMDLYGSEDLDDVLSSAASRMAAGKKGGGSFTQVKVDGANHFFQGHEAELQQQVLDWLGQHWR